MSFGKAGAKWYLCGKKAVLPSARSPETFAGEHLSNFVPKHRIGDFETHAILRRTTVAHTSRTDPMSTIEAGSRTRPREEAASAVPGVCRVSSVAASGIAAARSSAPVKILRACLNLRITCPPDFDRRRLHAAATCNEPCGLDQAEVGEESAIGYPTHNSSGL